MYKYVKIGVYLMSFDFDTSYPVYLGVSKSFFNEVRYSGRLHNVHDLKFTPSMEEAEAQAREAANSVNEPAGIVIKFDAEALSKHPAFVNELIKEIEKIFKFISGYYEVLIEIIFDHGGDYC